MADIKFTREEKQAIGNKIQSYFQEELDQELGQFDAEFLLDFFAKEIGPYFYNRGLHDAQTVLEERMEHFREALYEIEKPVT